MTQLSPAKNYQGITLQQDLFLDLTYTSRNEGQTYQQNIIAPRLVSQYKPCRSTYTSIFWNASSQKRDDPGDNSVHAEDD